jgi:hypothetical protein
MTEAEGVELRPLAEAVGAAEQVIDDYVRTGAVVWGEELAATVEPLRGAIRRGRLDGWVACRGERSESPSASGHAGPLAAVAEGAGALPVSGRLAGVRAVPDLWRPEIEQVLDTAAPAMTFRAAPQPLGEGTAAEESGMKAGGVPSDQGDGSGRAQQGAGLAVPIVLRGQTIGVLGIEDPDASQRWSGDQVDLLEAVGQQLALALENARLFEETQRRAERERLVTDITARIRSSTDMLGVLETTATELGKALGTSRVLVRLAPVPEPALADGADPRQGTLHDTEVMGSTEADDNPRSAAEGEDERYDV